MKILHIHSGNIYGGVETILMSLARNHRFAPAIEVAYGLCFEGKLSQGLIAEAIPVEILGRVRISKPWTILSARRKLRALLRSKNFEIAICHSVWSQLLFAPEIRRAGIQNGFWLHNAAKGRHWLERCARLFPPDFAICNSHATQSTLPKLYPQVPAETFYCPLSFPKEKLTPLMRQHLRKEMGAQSETAIIIQVSRLEKSKGHQLHLQALSQLLQIPNWVAVFVGGPQSEAEGQQLTRLKSLAADLKLSDRVRFLGHRNDVGNLLQASDIFCQPNENPEGFGIVFVEALMAGLPVVTTDLGAAPEIINSEVGILIPQEDAVAMRNNLSTRLRELIQNPELRYRLGSNGPAKGESLCGAESQMLKFQNLLINWKGKSTHE